MKKTNDKENEINILSNLDHPNLIKFFYSFSNEQGIYIVMEFCEYGDLYSLLQSVKKKKVYVNEEIIWDVASQTLLGLEYLHSKQIIHRDIKLLNLFMTKDKTIKIGDMGMSKHVEEGEMIISRVGTPLYIAPELVKKEKYDYKIDIWSFGCSLYHLAKTNPPFNDENLIKLGNSIINEQPAHLPSCYSNQLYEFILILMTKNKSKRPSASEALKLIPEKIKKKLNKKILEENKKNNNKKNKNLNQEKNVVNNDININESKDDSSNNNNDRDIYSRDNLKNSDNINLNINMNKALISGQTFYQFFKNNPEKKKNHKYFGINKNDKNSKNLFLETKINNNNNVIINNKDLLLSKTMSQIKDNYYKIKSPGNFKIYGNNSINFKNINNMKLVSQSSQNYGKLKEKDSYKNLEEEKKENNLKNIEEIKIKEEGDFYEEKNEGANKIKKDDISMNKFNKNDISDFMLSNNKKENKNSMKSENDRYNFKIFNNKNKDNKTISNSQDKKISMIYNRKEIMGKFIKHQNINEKDGGIYLYSNNIHNAIKTFLVKDSKDNNNLQFNKNRKTILNNNLKRNNFNLDNSLNSLNNKNDNNNKEELIFPLIFQQHHNNLKNKNNSNNNEHKRYYNNFRKTLNSNNFRNKLTIHDLK